MKSLHFFIVAISVILFSNCSVEPQSINYGIDNCEQCKMTISDKKFGGEIVTSKGKIYKFDSGECMISYLKSKGFNTEHFSILITDHQSGNLIDAKTAYYLISEKLNSPMAAGLTAYKNKNDVDDFKNQYTGSIYNWEQVINLIK